MMSIEIGHIYPSWKECNTSVEKFQLTMERAPYLLTPSMIHESTQWIP